MVGSGLLVKQPQNGWHSRGRGFDSHRLHQIFDLTTDPCVDRIGAGELRRDDGGPALVVAGSPENRIAVDRPALLVLVDPEVV